MDIKNLETQYLNAKEQYYNGTPVMTDFEFDTLEQELIAVGSDVVKIVGTQTDRNAKFPHITPMLSLAKFQASQNGDAPTVAFVAWAQPIAAKSQNHFGFTPKFDGNAANAIYKNGKLWKILSRGNGTAGRDYTKKLKIQVPATIPVLGEVEVRGEVVIAKSVFAAKYSTFKNERNFVAGVLNNDKSIPAEKDIVFMAMEIKQTVSGISEYIPVSNLETWGFNKNYKLPEFYYHYNDFQTAYNKMLEYRNTSCPFLLDGFVVKVAEKYRPIFGENSHDPNWAVAIKFPAKEVIATIIDIEWNQGKTGQFTPVAIFEPVDLDGSTVARASAYNYGFVMEKGLKPGTRVTLRKAGDIIPQILTVLD